MSEKKKLSRRVWIGLGLMALGVVVALLPMHVEMTGLVLAGYGFLCLADRFVEKHGWRRGWRRAILAVGVAVFLILGAGTTYVLIQGQSQWDAARGADYAVVLGAQIRGQQPSRTLRERLDVALEFLEENQDAIVIVSGGQGSDEVTTEAAVMYDYLAGHGGDMDRVFREPEAHNTRENLHFSAAIAAEQGLDPAHPAIITSEFHLCRAKYIASTLGMEASGLGSRTTPWILKVNYALREVFAFVKAWLVAAA